MIHLLLATLGVSVASALIPVVNAELYLGVVATQVEDQNLWLIAGVAALGQTAGKVVWYVAAWKSLESAWVRKRLDEPGFAASVRKWIGKAEGRPWFMGSLNFVSAAGGIPPLLVLAVVAGAVRLNFVVFLATTFVGRALRFWVVLAGVDLLWV